MVKWIAAISGSTAGFNDNATRYTPIGGVLFASTTNEVASSQHKIIESYTLSSFWVKVAANQVSLTGTFTVRKNVGNATALTVSIGADLTGEFTETASSVAYASGDTFGCQWTAPDEASTNTLTCAGIAVLVDSAKFPALGYLGAVLLTADRAHALFGSSGGTAPTEAQTQNTFRRAATLSNFRLGVFSNSATTVTATVRKNGANAGPSISILSGTTGNYEDITNTATFAAADEGGTYFDITAGASCNLGLASASIDPAGHLMSFGNYSNILSTTVYMCLTTGAPHNTVETTMQAKAQSTEVAFKNFGANVISNTATAVRTLALRKNATSAISISLGTSVTGILEETSTSVSPAATDNFNFMATGSSGGIAVALFWIEEFALPKASAALILPFPIMAAAGTHTPPTQANAALVLPFPTMAVAAAQTAAFPQAGLLDDFTGGDATYNWCTNPGFEVDLTDWAVIIGGETLTRITSAFHSGAASLEVVTTGTAAQGAQFVNFNAKPIQGTTDTARVWVKAKAAGDVGKFVTVLLGAAGSSEQAFSNVALTASWQQVTVSATWTLNTGTGTFIHVRDAVGVAVSFQIDDVELSRPDSDPNVGGRVATPSGRTWTAPMPGHGDIVPNPNPLAITGGKMHGSHLTDWSSGILSGSVSRATLPVECYCTIGSWQQNLTWLISTPGTGTTTGYMSAIQPGFIEVYRVTNGALIFLVHIDVSLVAGDKAGFRHMPDGTIHIYVNKGAGWVAVGSVVDNTYSSGQFAMFMPGPDATNWIDDFGGGNPVGPSAFTLPFPVMSAIGAFTQVGSQATAALVLPSPLMSAAGEQTQAGVSGLIAPFPVMAATGQQRELGTAGLILPFPVASAVGLYTPLTTQGYSNLILPFPVMSAAGKAPYAAIAGLVLPFPVMSAVGEETQMGAAALVLPFPVMSALGIQKFLPGTSAFVLPFPVMSALGVEAFRGTAAGVLPFPVMLAGGVQAFPGTGIYILPFPVMSAAGKSVTPGRGVLVMPFPIMTARGRMLIFEVIGELILRFPNYEEILKWPVYEELIAFRRL